MAMVYDAIERWDKPLGAPVLAPQKCSARSLGFAPPEKMAVSIG
jgi:hypothetical protein